MGKDVFQRFERGRMSRAVLMLIAFCSLILLEGNHLNSNAEGLGPGVSNGTGAKGTPKIAPTLRRAIKEGRGSDLIRVVVHLKKSLPEKRTDEVFRRGKRLEGIKRSIERDQAAFIEYGEQSMRLHRPGWMRHTRDRIRPFWITNSVAMTVAREQIEELAAHPDVLAVEENAVLFIPPVEVLDGVGGGFTNLWNLRVIGVDEARNLGLDGSGIRIGHLDTGMDAGHPDLKGKLTAWAEFDRDGERIESDPHETHSKGHGTHIASTLVGEYTGVAPGASLISALILPSGYGTIEQALAGIQWVLDPDGDVETEDGAQIVNMSWGMAGRSAVLREAIENMVSLGVLPVAAIGNGGIYSTYCPGNVPEAIGVGAVDENDLAAPYSGGDNVCWEGTLCTIKPDISAPGNSILGAKPGGGYQLLAGTSTASPHVAGAAALLLQHYELDVGQLKSSLFYSSLDLGTPGHDYQYGQGRLDIGSALYFMDKYAARLGAPDLVLETTRDFPGVKLHQYHMFFSDGQGGLVSPCPVLQVFPDSAGAVLRTVGVADVNGDGFSDLVVSQSKPLDSTHYSIEYRVYPGGERRGFSTTPIRGQSFVSSSPDPHEVIGLADVNGDKRTDLVLCEKSKLKFLQKIRVFVLLAGEGGILRESGEDWCTISEHEQFQIDMRVGDIDGDGKADLVYAKGYGYAYAQYPVYCYAEVSDGTRFQQPLYWLIIYPSAYPLKSQGSMDYLTLADADGDGFADLILTTQLLGTKGIYVYPSNGKNGFRNGRLWAAIGPDDRVGAVQDVNGDGAADLIFSSPDAGQGYPKIRAWFSNGQNQFSRSNHPWLDTQGVLQSTTGFRLTGVGDVGLGDWKN